MYRKEIAVFYGEHNYQTLFKVTMQFPKTNDCKYLQQDNEQLYVVVGLMARLANTYIDEYVNCSANVKLRKDLKCFARGCQADGAGQVVVLFMYCSNKALIPHFLCAIRCVRDECYSIICTQLRDVAELYHDKMPMPFIKLC